MLNKIFLVGTVQDEPKVSFLQEGKKVARFTLITSKEIAGRDPIVAFHRCVAWNATAQLCLESLHKDSLIFLEGEVNYGSFTDKDGNKKYTTDIQAYRIQSLNKKESGHTEPAAAKPDLGEIPKYAPDDLPF